MVRRRGRRSPCAVLVASAVVAAGAAAAPPAGPRYSGTDPATETYTTSWDSSPFNLESVTDNNLGLMAKSCSERFCHAGINGLDLWISFEEVCTLSSQPYFATLLGEQEEDQQASASAAGASAGVGGTLASGDWHPISAGLLCGVIGAASMVAGFKLGGDFHSYQKDILH